MQLAALLLPLQNACLAPPPLLFRSQLWWRFIVSLPFVMVGPQDGRATLRLARPQIAVSAARALCHSHDMAAQPSLSLSSCSARQKWLDVFLPRSMHIRCGLSARTDRRRDSRPLTLARWSRDAVRHAAPTRARWQRPESSLGSHTMRRLRPK